MTEVVLVFPGQGSQFTGMGKAWFDANASVRDRFQEASDIVGYSLEDLCFAAPPSELTKTRHAQVSLLVVSYAMFEVLMRQRPVTVSAMAGHSLGEITALLAAGALTFEDAVHLVKVRGEAMEVCATQNRTGMIAAVRMPVADVEKCVEDFNTDGHHIQVANYNAEQQTVLSGTVEDLKGMTAYLEDRGCKVARLNVAGAFHSTFMDDAVPPYVEAIGEIEFSVPRVPVHSTVTGRPYGSAEEIKDALAVQLTSPVRWSAVVSAIAGQGSRRLWIEVGPKHVLTRLISGSVDRDEVYSLDDDSDEAAAALDRVVEAKKREPGLVGLCMGAAAATRNRNFDDDEYAAGVIRPYRRLQELSRAEAESELTAEQKQEALDLLRTIMATKRVPEEEQQDRIATIARRTGNGDLVAPAGAATT